MMNRTLKTTLMGLALLLFVGSFFVKQLSLSDNYDYAAKILAILILVYIVVRQRARRRPTDPL